MIGVLLMSHGQMAEGLLDTCKLFFGDDIPQIKALCLQACDSPEEFDERIREAINELDDGHGVIGFCDLLGGTPCNRSFYVLNDRFQVVTGMNMPVVMELLGSRLSTEDVAEIDINALLETGKTGMTSLNNVISDTELE